MSSSVSAASTSPHHPPELNKSFSDEPKTGETETIKHSSSSIIGLRTAAFEPSAKKSEESVGVEDTVTTGLKPRPSTKPRPWSIVGVDRKSGEYTSVETTAECVEEDETRLGGGSGGSLLAQSVGRGSVRDMIASLNKPDSPGAGGGVAVPSVRDRIANMNKTAEPADNAKRKGNSLPRSVDPSAAAAAGSPGARPKNSPINRKKESTSDDPRILQLEDDIFFEDTVNV